MRGESFLSILQKYATLVHRVDDVTSELKDLRSSSTEQLARLEATTADIRERLARLEASRDADRSHMQADLARFKLEVERAELRLSQPPRNPPEITE